VAEDDQLIAGRYRLAEQVGSGAMGVVWRAEDEVLRRTVALKQVRLPSGVDDNTRNQAYRRVMREGRLFARLHHPNAIAVFDVVDHADQPWLVMEYLPSESLSEAVAAHGVLSPTAAAHVGHQVAAALTAAHTAGIVHRDVKPGNVLLGADGVVKVTDFGVSRAIDEATVTSSGMMAGTPAYLAPEVARGADADFRSDVYSLGSTLYAAVEGRPPFGQDENALAQLHRVASGDYTPPRHAGSLTSLLERVLAADPARRPEMHQVRDELGRLAAVEAETDEWTGSTHEPTGPTLPVSASARAVTSAPTPVPDPASHPGPQSRPGPPSRPAPASSSAPASGPEPTIPATTIPAPSGAAAADVLVRSPEAQDDPEEPDDDDRPRRRRGALIGAGLAVLLVGAVVAVALVLSMRSGDGGATTAGGAAPTTADQPGTASTGQASGSGDGTGTGDGSGSSNGSGSGDAASAAPVAQGTPEQVAQQQAIIDYYGLIPSNLPEGWQRLTPSYQSNTAGGYSSYAGFWGGMSRVSVQGVSSGPGGTVDATVVYVHQGGRTNRERTLFRMVQQDGTWKIDSSQVLESS
jgi:serine/threonine protein kinase